VRPRATLPDVTDTLPIPQTDAPAGAESVVATDDPGFDGFTVRLPAFEGPLDLLLHLIRKHEIDLFDIPIHFITSEYLRHLQLLEELDVTVSSEFLVMAATLVHIKSQMLLPSQFLRSLMTDAEYRKSLAPEDPRFELVQALLSRQAVETVAAELGRRDEQARCIYFPDFERSLDGFEGDLEIDLSGLTINRLLTAFERVLTRERDPAMTVMAARLSVGDVMREIRHLRQQGHLAFTFRDLIREEPRGYRIVAVFLALLELARQGRLRLEQEEPDGDIAAAWEDQPSGVAA